MKKEIEYTAEDVRIVRAILQLTKAEFSELIDCSPALVDLVEREQRAISKKLAERMMAFVESAEYKAKLKRVESLCDIDQCAERTETRTMSM